MPTDNQLLHRQYIRSPAWNAKRLDALAHYGPTCSRCGEYGTDVHHRTYERVDGDELMEDLEILCRDCHEAHHQAERCPRRPRQPKRKAVRQDAIFRMLSPRQKEKLAADYGIWPSQLYLELGFGKIGRLVIDAARILGFDAAYEPRRDPCRSKLANTVSHRKKRCC